MKAMLKSGSTETSAASGNGRSTQRRTAGTDPFRSLADAPRTIAQRKQIEGAFGSAIQRAGVEEEEPLQGKFEPVQRAGLEEEEPLQGKFEPVQRAGLEEEPMQGKFEPVQRAAGESSDAPAPNRTGMPDSLKSGIESLSGLSMDNVKVHYGSSQPAQLNALAYAQGSDIHIAPGQEHHLPHEAWHVVQQAQGRVQPTMQLNEGVPVNDDTGLEKEADAMGEKASRVGS